MCGRFRSGAGGGRVQNEGEWNCQACGMVGCWPTKRQCFRCCTPRYVRNGGVIGGQPREQNELGRLPPSPSTGNPSYWVLRTGAPQNQGSFLPVPVAGGDMSLPISFLQTPGLPQEVMSQVESKLAPPRQKEITDEKALALAKAKLDRWWLRRTNSTELSCTIRPNFGRVKNFWLPRWPIWWRLKVSTGRRVTNASLPLRVLRLLLSAP